MRTGSLMASLSVLLAMACGPGAAPFDQTQKQALSREVAETLTNLTEAMNRHDPDEVLSYYRESDQFIYLGCTSLMIGWDTFSPRAWSYHVANPNVTFHQEIVGVQVLSPTVAVAALQGGSTKAEALFWTEVLVKEGGAWKIAQEHESWPGCPPPPTPHPYTAGEPIPDTLVGGGGQGVDTVGGS